MDPEHRAPTLIGAYVWAAVLLALCAIYWFSGVFDQLGSIHQFALGN
jgi:hypothetical protein